jgi:hypothetical protein
MVDHPLAGSMQRLDILLLDRFLRHEAHVGLPGRRADRLGIVAVVLLTHRERLDVLRADDLDRVPKALELALPIEGAVQASIAMVQGSSCAMTWSRLSRITLRLSTTRPAALTPCS